MEMTNTRIVPGAAGGGGRAQRSCDPQGLDSRLRILRVHRRRPVARRRGGEGGPVSARFTGNVKMADRNPPTGYTLKFEGQGGAAGFANGEAKVTLALAEKASTALTYVVSANVGGKIAQIGSRSSTAPRPRSPTSSSASAGCSRRPPPRRR